MKYQYHVLTPFSRFGNLLPLAKMLQDFGVKWHPIFDGDLPFGIHNIQWIEPCYCGPKPNNCHPANHALNWFLDVGGLIPEHRYLILADDDFYEPGFFDKIDQHDGEFLICSMLRGNHQPATGPQYGTSPLIAAFENLRLGKVGAEQMVVSGRILAPRRFRPEAYSDGLFIEALCKEYKPELVPEANVWFNYLEPGRWDR